MIQAQPTLVIDHMSERGFELYGPKGTKKWLDQIGASYVNLSTNKQDLTGYPTYEEITAELKGLAAKYPQIMKLSSIGKSVEGRELWVIKISDNVETDEVEPEFKYISSMHGDEITGRELTRFWVKDILEGYGKDQKITDLVNNSEIFVMPSMNPDGSEKRTRGNANYVDLNRNFPDWTSASTVLEAPTQPETQAVMDFQKSRQFSLSANFHGGAVVVNYPWDATYERHPLDSLLQEMSLAYADLNSEMRNSGEFDRGITNGADWYLVKGGMQDWSYYFYNDLQVTIELSNQKWPSYSRIPSYYQDNKESMFKYAEYVHQGAGFKLRLKTNGVVKIQKLEKSGSLKNVGVFGFTGGEFYKILDPGKYVFTLKVGKYMTSFYPVVEANKIFENGNYHQL